MLKKMIVLFMVLLFSVCISCDDDNDSLTKEIIKSPDAPKAIGPYSQAVKVGNTLYCSGQIAINPQTGKLVTETIEEETEQVLENLAAVLKEAGMDFSNVVRATVFMSDIKNYSKINGIYAKYFKKNPPARAAVEVANLPKYVNVEISCIAVKTN
jgi:2-iminobutanoate/2-iminopropanoate deaminase